MEKVKSQLKRIKKKYAFIAVIILIFALLPSIYFYKQYKNSQNPTTKTQNEVADLVAKIGKLYVLPQNENPTVATVSDKNKLKDQPFFANAENGDKVLIYTKSQKAILYRPSINKIIEVAPVNLGQNLNATPSPQVSPSIAQTIKLVIYNGTKTSGLARKEGESLEVKYSNLEVIATSNAAEDYTQNLVIDLSGKNAEFVKTLASELSGRVSSLPSSETKPSNADILIILGE